MMNIEKFTKRIESGKANNLIYAEDGRQGLVSTWKYNDLYILTWEECPTGEQYDESKYTKDERYEFSSINELIATIRDKGLDVTRFRP